MLFRSRRPVLHTVVTGRDPVRAARVETADVAGDEDRAGQHDSRDQEAGRGGEAATPGHGSRVAHGSIFSRRPRFRYRFDRVDAYRTSNDAMT